MTAVNKLLDYLFYLFLILAFGCAAFIVLGQAFAIVTMNTNLAVWLKKLIVLNARFGAGLSMTTLIMGYLRGWMGGSKKKAKA